nr:HK97 family phage prohead protease [Aureimonas populi]
MDAREDGLVRGYASLFERTDPSGDRIERGAFARTLKERGAAGIRMLWQHDPAEPIGVWTAIAEDSRGLLVEGKLALSTRRGRDVFELIRAGAVDGLSIGFKARRARREPGGVRRIAEIDLWEISVVTFPMQALARLAETRGRDLPRRIREAARRLARPARAAS